MEVLGKQIGLQRQPDINILDVFQAPGFVESVEFDTDEFTSLCPITGQPDFAHVHIEYQPGLLCLESKSLKHYLQSYRDEGAFIESLANRIAAEIFGVLQPLELVVEITSVPRGGIALKATARLAR